MAETKVVKCKICGEPLDLTTLKDYVIKCAVCDAFNTLPKEGTDPEALRQLSIGDDHLRAGHFDDAFEAFKKAYECDRREPEALWGIALSEFRVRYIKDELKDRKRLQPICYRVTDKKFTDNKCYQAALQIATPAQRVEYRKRAEEIDYIRDQFNELRREKKTYDCFICVKVSRLGDEQREGDQKNWTQDAYAADQIYDKLKEKGYRPFFSERDIKQGTAGADYEAEILYALHTCETMLVVCRDEQYLRTPWVKNEYSRYLQLMNDGRKDPRSITIVYFGSPIENLPGQPGRLQGIDYSKSDAIDKISKFVYTHTPQARTAREKAQREKLEQQRRQEEERRRIAADNEATKRRMAEWEARQAERERQQAEREKQQEARHREEMAAAKEAATAAPHKNIKTNLMFAEQQLELGIDNRDEEALSDAKDTYKQVLREVPNNCAARWGLFLIDFRVKHEDYLIQRLDSKLCSEITANANYRLALEPSRQKADGDKDSIARINAFVQKLQSPAKWWSLFLQEMSVDDEQTILKYITTEKVNMVQHSKNFYFAKQYADDEYRARIARFEHNLKSPEVNYKLFLREFNVQNEEELFSGINDRLKEKIDSSGCYHNALEAAGELGTRLNRFNAKLHSGELWWDLFIKDNSGKSVQEIQNDLRVDEIEYILENENYINAKNYASGALKEKIEEFESVIKSAKFWWSKFLAEYGIYGDDEGEIYKKINLGMLSRIENSPNLHYAKENAAGDLRVRLSNFDKKLHSAALWWGRFLDNFHAKDEEEILGKFSYKVYDDVKRDKFLEKAREYFDYDVSTRDKAKKFIAALEDQKKALEEAERQWRELLAAHECASDADLYRLAVPVTGEAAFIAAGKYAALSRNAEFIGKVEKVRTQQPDSARANNRKKTARTVRRCLLAFVIALLLCIPLVGEYLLIAQFADDVAALDLWADIDEKITKTGLYLGISFMRLFYRIFDFGMFEGNYALSTEVTLGAVAGLGVLQQLVGMITGMCGSRKIQRVRLMIAQLLTFLLFIGQQYIFANFNVAVYTEWGLTAVIVFIPLLLFMKNICRSKLYGSSGKSNAGKDVPMNWDKEEKPEYSPEINTLAICIPLFIVAFACECVIAAWGFSCPRFFDEAEKLRLVQVAPLALTGVYMLFNIFGHRSKWKTSIVAVLVMAAATLIILLGEYGEYTT